MNLKELLGVTGGMVDVFFSSRIIGTVFVAFLAFFSVCAVVKLVRLLGGWE